MDKTITRAVAAARELRRKLGDQAVVTDAARLMELGGDKWFARRQPDFAVFPRTSAEIVEVMRVASERSLPVTTRGSGYGYVGGCVPATGGIVLGTQRMNRIVLRAKTRRTEGRSMKAICEDLNGLLHGWFAYFKHSKSTVFTTSEGYTRGRLRSILRKRRGGRGRGRGRDHQRWSNDFFHAQGLISLNPCLRAIRQSP